jgi:GNAT superfamily N-acetyltransferase
LSDVGIEEQELNELHWWSHWAEVTMLDIASYVILSEAFQEPLFNHATILTGGRSADEAVGTAFSLFREAHVRPSFFVIDDLRYLGTMSALESAGFAAKDTMEVLAAGSTRLDEERTVEMVEVKADPGRWAEAYVRSFYGGDAPLAAVEAAVGNAAEDKDVSLILATRGGKDVGEMALFRRGGLLGAYCVGTIPEHRRSGVGGQMLSHAMQSASEQHLRLVLQTFAADGVVDFYARHGFERAYRKYVLLPGKVG